MEIEVIKDLVKVADSLDKKGLYKESDLIDSLILKLAGWGRPTQDEIQNKANQIYLLPPTRRFSAIADIEDMATGENLDGIREKYYPGWKDEDFKTLLQKLNDLLDREELEK
jgi:hypothetical protein